MMTGSKYGTVCIFRYGVRLSGKKSEVFTAALRLRQADLASCCLYIGLFKSVKRVRSLTTWQMGDLHRDTFHALLGCSFVIFDIRKCVSIS